MNEIPLFFKNNDNQHLFGIIHEPEGNINKPLWVFCHPFAEEKLWSHRVYVNLARKLCSLGYVVLRFDYRGYGDSEGQFERSTLAGQLDDIESAIKYILLQYPTSDSVALLGLRYGAVLAALTAEKSNEVSHLVLWDPIIDMSKYMQELLRANLTTQMVMYGKVVKNRTELSQKILEGEAVNIDGYDLTRDLFEPADKINLLEMERTFSGPCQIVQIGRANQPLKKDLEQLASTYPEGVLQQVVEEAFWKEIKNFVQRSDALTNCLLEWMDENSYA